MLLTVILASVVAGWLMWMEVQVHQRLAQLQWELPSRVYARAIDLYAGAPVGMAILERHLARAGYGKRATVELPGDYSRSGADLSVYLRGFSYWDGVELARRVEVRFSGRQIASLKDSGTGRPVDLLRVDPPLIGRIVPHSNEDRRYVPPAEIPALLRQAIVVVEDRQFFRHHGVDLRGILRALWVNVRAGEVEQGGSTLTQQLVKNLFLAPDRTIARKVTEAAMAILVERKLTKDQILWVYVNEVYLGQHGATAVHGFGAAAEYYFRRPLAELRVHQMALLVGLVRGASYYNPWRHPERARQRRDLILRLMQQAGHLTAPDAETARGRELDITDRPEWSRELHPAFMELVRRELREIYSEPQLATGGLRIFTTLDMEAQESLEQGIVEVLHRTESRRRFSPGSLQAAGVILDFNTGEVVALTGGRGETAGSFNRALMARRPIGSLVKPFVYLEALADSERYNLLSPLDDLPYSIQLPGGGTWQPENYDRRPHGTVTVLEALSRSYNVSTVRLGMEIGPERVMGLLHRSGLAQTPTPRPSALLGAFELSPVGVAQIYQALANGGFRIPLTTIREAVGVDGRGLARHEMKISKAFDPAPAFLVAWALTEATTRGTGGALPGLLGRTGKFPGKTGTTDDLRDSWFAGFGGRYLGVIWTGRDDNKPMGLTGATGALPVWAEVMRRLEAEPWPGIPPSDVHWLQAPAVPMEGACRDLGYIPYIGVLEHGFPGC